MFWQSVITTGLLAAAGAHAGRQLDGIADAMLTPRNQGMLEGRMEFFASPEGSAPHPDHPIVIAKRQSPDIILNSDGSLNMTAWENLANAACNEALLKLPESTNPSGTCICYNLPALNNVTGAFEADLRLYQLSTPSGAFAGIPPQNIQVGLTYRGAAVSPVTPQTAQKAVAMRQAAPSAAAGGAGSQPFGNQLMLLQTYLFVGQIDQTKMKPGLSMAELEALVMPVVTLSGVNAAGQRVSTNVSSNEAAFVAGVFSQEVIMSDFALANAAVDKILTQMTNQQVAFVLPGVNILIFPTGLVICGAWLVLFMAAVGYGTYMRMNFREQYRRRAARAGVSKAMRI
ncbi:uncharacterized protein E0L32_008752 [Thyridium curvatum]|uniref:Uncharacterized protein n=1 Tax=Thyridium curvatum TaxID=1093900 RepID=A0A507AS99_9PEZI|nr:uncharacterized protein E0L32_008752 [Thyridium curvatum]TPX10347.1 hypothetical protein E0L32_008752 [Thyridium curvatum]